jgi:hypothetical protein
MGAKIFLGLFAAASVLTLTTVGAGAAVLYGSGTFSVETHDRDGAGVALSLPAALAHLALWLAPDELLADIHDELEPVWPTVEAAARELHRAPDFVLLEVRSSDEHVVIAKRDGHLLIEVDADGDRVRVDVPLGTLRRLVERLGDRPAWG